MRLIVACATMALNLGAHAGMADVIHAQADCDTHRRCTVTVTVRHADSGWDHYANAWIVRAPDGHVLATRTLLHPHVDEQPFTRSLNDVLIPRGLDHVVVEAIDSVHGAGGIRVELPLK